MTPPTLIRDPCLVLQTWDDDANVLCYAASTRQHAYGDYQHAFYCHHPTGDMAFEDGLAGRYLFVRLPARPRSGSGLRRLRLCEVRMSIAGRNPV
jgi:hypothetical protein